MILKRLSLIEEQPELVLEVAPEKPAETMGMSPLQVALNTGWHREIAWFLWITGRMSTIWLALNISCMDAA